MALYCDSDDVVEAFKGIDLDNGIVTVDLIDKWIKQASAYIEGRVCLSYLVPITAEGPLEILREICTGLVAQRIARKLEVKSTGSNGDQYIPKDLIKESKENLSMIVRQELILIDAERATTHAGVQSYTSDNSTERVFDTESDQW